MSNSEFNAYFFGEFKPDVRLNVLDNRLASYYAATENLNNREALVLYKAFKLWCADNGYTQDEVNRAKRNYKG